MFLAKPLHRRHCSVIVATRRLRGSVLFENQGATRLNYAFFNATDDEKTDLASLEAACERRDSGGRGMSPRALSYSRCQEFDALTDARRQRAIASGPDFDELRVACRRREQRRLREACSGRRAAELGAACRKGEPRGSLAKSQHAIISVPRRNQRRRQKQALPELCCAEGGALLQSRRGLRQDPQCIGPPPSLEEATD